ncbi:hypothetical protein V2J09_009527 [Rumex salicifolius]
MEMKMEIEEVERWRTNNESLPLLSLNHVSLLCRSVWTSIQFYQNVLGFFLIKRPSSFNFPGAWLYNYGIGIHLLESPSMEEYDSINDPRPINPKDNHISFQCTDVETVKRRLEEWGMRHVSAVVEEGGAKVDQLFFHDPDGYMIEICNCDNIPVVPVDSISCPDLSSKGVSCRLTESAMMENLSMDMINFSF